MGHRLSKIYTRTGDAGTTGLGDGSRTAKNSARVAAMGDVDELNSLLGVVYPVPDAQFSATPQITTVSQTNVDFTDLSVGNPVTWSWSFGTGDPADTSNIQNPSFQYTQEYGSTYPVVLVVTNQYGCVDSATLDVIVQPEFTFYVPNAFTPNGDGINEVFFGQGMGIPKYEMWIFDGWGNLIFTCTDINQSRDGTVQGKGGQCCQIDTYVWKVAITDVFDKKHKFIGHVSLMR